ncbi:MAG: serine hydrolase [Sphingomonas sp.]|nr:MAG: serine hydrolase [Sphingomonas sp.]
MTRLAVILAISTSLLAAAAPAQQADGIDKLLAGPSANAAPGCAVGVSRDGKVVAERAYGMADIEHGIPATPQSIYEAGSVSKQFTAAALLLLARDGKLKLSDDIRTYLPELQDYGAPVTIRHMIQHISGLRDWGAVAAMEGWPRNSRSANNQDVLAIAARQAKLNFAPGSHYSYSNSNYNLAAILVSRVSGESLADFTRKRIFEPLGMGTTHWRDSYQRLVPGRATAYAREGGGYVIDQPIEDAYGNGGLLTTVKDLLIWNDALQADKLGAGFRDEMEQVGVLTDGTHITYASGLMVSTHRGVREVAHSGSTGGYRAWLARYPAQGLSIALLCNGADSNPITIGRSIADLYLSGLAPLPAYKPSGPAPSGLFVSAASGLPLRIKADADGRLSINNSPLTPVAKGRWRLQDTDYLFGKDGNLIVEANGEKLPYRRVEQVETTDPAPYAGRYCGTDNPFCMLITKAADGGLAITTTGRLGLAAQPLKPAAADLFTSGAGTVRFLRAGSGRVNALHLGDSRAWAVEFVRVE